MLASVGIAHHRARTVIDLRFLTGSGDDHHTSFRRLGAAQLAREALHALVAAGETVLGDQVLPDRHGIAASAESRLDGLAIGYAGTGAGTALWRCSLSPLCFREKSAHFVSLGWAEVGDHLRVGNHLVGRF